MNFKILIFYTISIVVLGFAQTEVTEPDSTVTDASNTDPPSADPTAVTDPPSADPTAVTDPAATDPAVTDPAATDPAVTDPVATDPAVTDPVVTESPSTDAPSTDPAATEPPATDAPSTDPAATEPPSTDPAATEPPSTDPAATDPPSTDPPATTIETTTEEETTTTPAPALFIDDVNTCTQNLLGINCMVENVYNIQDVAENFQYEISLCSSKIQKESATILNKVKELNEYATKIEQVNKNACKNGNYNAKKDATKTPSAKCVKNITNNMNKLNDNIEFTLNKVNKYYYKTTNGCASMALLKLKLNLNNFPSYVKSCAKLADNV